METEIVATEPFSDEILNDYRTWKKNTPYLYDSFISAAIPWPSLTVQWLPDLETIDDDLIKQRLLLGTQTSGNGDEFLRFASLTRPATSKIDTSVFDPERKEYGKYQRTQTSVEISHKINHSVGEINRARFMPQNCNIIATMSSNGRSYVFDRTKHSLEPSQFFKSDMVLDGHSQEGFALSWSPFRAGHLLTASDSIVLWDVTKYSKDDKALKPQKVWKSHQQIINEVEWHPHDENLFGSVSDDCEFQLHDLRQEGNVQCKGKYKDAINTVNFSPGNKNLAATGSSDGTVQLWDLRNLEQGPFRVLTNGHSDSITQVKWSPSHPTVLASSSVDKTVLVWDIANDGDGALIFRHGGHKAEVNDLAWNPAKEWEIASVGSDNQVQIWRISRSIVG